MKANGMISHSRHWNGAHTMKNSHNSFTKPLRPRNTALSRCWFNSEMRFELSGRTKVVASLFLFSATLFAAAAAKEAAAQAKSEAFAPTTELIFHQITYDAKVTDDGARFVVAIDAESLSKQQVALTLFEGELALLPSKLPEALHIEGEADQYRLLVSKPGRYQFKLELVAKVKHVEPWNQILFKGPAAAISSVTAQAAGADVDLQLLSGTLLASTQTNGIARVKGFLSADQTLALRWSRTGGTAEVARRAVVTTETEVKAQITPTVVKYVTQLRYEIIQGKLPKIVVALPANHALTRLAGEQIRDWEIKPASASQTGMQILEVQFIKPLEKQCLLTLFSEQTVEATPGATSLIPPQPIEIERESGSFTIAAEDTVAEVESATGLRQVNAPAGSLASYRFNGRPFALAVNLHRIEPVISVAERVSARIEETRLVSAHTLVLNIEKAGVYALVLTPPAGFLVGDVHGEGLEDWKLSDGVLRVNFSSRVQGQRKLEVLLEQ